MIIACGIFKLDIGQHIEELFNFLHNRILQHSQKFGGNFKPQKGFLAKDKRKKVDTNATTETYITSLTKFNAKQTKGLFSGGYRKHGYSS